MSQIMDLTSLPFAFKHIAIMPDAHAGKGMPIGGVLATNGVIVPNAVGVDIGCGMCAIKTNLKAEDFSYTDLTSIMSKIRAVVPLGFDHQNKKQDQELLPQGFDFEEMPVLKNQYEACLKQIGTLGGGNHFIEIQKDTATSDVWVMIHSGSRNIGLKVANHYNKIAQYWNEKWYSEMVSGLAYLPMETQMAKDYFREMNYCVAFAFANHFNIVGLGKDFSKNLGVPYNLVLFSGLTIAAMITASIVVVVGSISYIGLIVPNVVAMYKGDKIRGTLVDTALFGAIFVLVCDMIGRVVIAPYELPIELIVGILGSLIFIALLFYRLKHGRKAIRLGGAGTSCCSTMPNLKGGADQ